MRLRKECEHGRWEAHSVVCDDPECIYHKDCPGGEFLPEGALFERLQDQLEDMFCLKLQNLGVHERGRCQSFAGDAIEAFKDALACTCSHVEDEHFIGNGHAPTACAVEDCACVQFEWDGEEVGESE